MAVSTEKKKELISKFKINASDTGSEQVQVALITENISVLTEHLKEHKKDFSSKRGLFKMISHRKKLLKYLEAKNKEGYKDLVKKLGLRK